MHALKHRWLLSWTGGWHLIKYFKFKTILSEDWHVHHVIFSQDINLHYAQITIYSISLLASSALSVYRSKNHVMSSANILSSGSISVQFRIRTGRVRSTSYHLHMPYQEKWGSFSVGACFSSLKVDIKEHRGALNISLFKLKDSQMNLKMSYLNTNLTDTQN